jgi:hypothetical protein
MKKRVILLVVIVAAIVAVVLFVLTGTEKVDISYLESMQLSPPENYIQELMSIVEENKDPYIRESAIFALTDIAVRKNETEEIIDFLKDIAINEPEDNVRTSAYANIYLIRDIYPLEKKGSLELSVSGDIRKESNITLIAEVSSTIDIEEEAIIGITNLDNNIELLSDGVHKIILEANIPRVVNFDLHLKETGRYIIPVTLKLSFDRIDYEKIHKEVYLIVNESNGESFQLEEGQE